MNKMKIKIFALLSLIIAFSLVLSSCDSLWDDLGSITISFDSNGGEGTMKPQNFVATVPQALQANTFTRTGYTFAGWATKADASKAEYADKANFTAKEDTTLYAIWSKIPPTPVSAKVAITYVSDHGTCPEAKTVEAGYKLTADDLSTLTAEGYRFIGWDKSVGDEITADTKITASWIKTWTITYSSSQGTAPKTKTVDEGYKLTAADLSTLPADGYNFKGWDKSIGDVITANTTITASWVKTWKISYELPSGYSKEPKIVEAGYKLTAEDLPNIEINDTYYLLDKKTGDEITADTKITGDWDGIVYLKTFSSVQEIKDNKAKIEKIIFTTDSYTGTGTGTPIDCADNSTNTAIGANYFTGVLTDGAAAGQYILTIYGNGHRIYAPVDSKQLFNGFSKVTSIEFNNFYTSKVTTMYAMFASCKELTSLDVSSFDTSNVTNMTGMFNGLSKITELNLSNFDTSKVTDISSMFSNCEKLKSVNLSSFDTSCVQYMNSMFFNCKALETLDVSKFKTSAVLKMANMFSSCETLKELDLSGFDTSAVTEMANMFSSCKALKELDLSGFDTSAVTKMANMFNGASALERIIFSSNFKTEKVESMSSMFDGCSKLTTIDLSSFKTEKVESMSSMFDGCSSLTTLDISSFTKGTNLTGIDGMFNRCSNLTTIYVSSGFDLSNMSGGEIFRDDTKLVGGANTSYSDIAKHDTETYASATYARIDTDRKKGYFTLKE